MVKTHAKNGSAICSQGTYFLAIIHPFKNTAGLHQRVFVAIRALQVLHTILQQQAHLPWRFCFGWVVRQFHKGGNQFKPLGAPPVCQVSAGADACKAFWQNMLLKATDKFLGG